MTLVEKAAYLKGLGDGLGVEPESREGKLWAALNSLLADMAHEIEDLKQSDQDFAAALDDLSADLTYLEEVTDQLDVPSDVARMEDCASCPGCAAYGYDDADDVGEDEDDEEDEDAEEIDAAEYDGVIYDVTCPTCGEELSFDEETLEEGSIRCPVCGELLEFDLDSEDGDDGDKE